MPGKWVFPSKPLALLSGLQEHPTKAFGKLNRNCNISVQCLWKYPYCTMGLFLRKPMCPQRESFHNYITVGHGAVSSGSQGSKVSLPCTRSQLNQGMTKENEKTIKAITNSFAQWRITANTTMTGKCTHWVSSDGDTIFSTSKVQLPLQIGSFTKA